MKTIYHVTYWATDGQPDNSFGTYTSKRAAITAARECVRTCLPRHSGGRVEVLIGGDTDNYGAEAIWTWLEHPNGGFGWHRANGDLTAAIIRELGR